MEKVINPSFNLEKALKNSSLTGVATEYSEIVYDSILKDGVLKDIPVVGAILGGVQFANSIQKYFITKKLCKFFFELRDIPEEVRRKKIDEINNSKKYSSSVGEMIFELLDKIESDGKPEIVGKLFKAVIEEKIEYKTYLQMTHIVKNVFYFDLDLLTNYDENDYIYDGNSSQLESYGLTSFNINAWHKPGPKDGCDGEITKLGKQLVNLGMK